MNTCDLIIIGAGPGGYETAAEAARQGLRVTLFERAEAGGTCLNRGCIPTKALCRSAEVLDTVRSAAEFGVEVEGTVKGVYARAHERMLAVVAQLRQGVEATLSGVNVVRAEARLLPDRRVEANGEVYEAERVIIATGSAPAALPIPGAELAMTSDDLLALTELPRSIVVIGGGVIGLELASVMCSFGVEVTVVEYCKEVLPPFDPDIAKRLRSQLSRRGIKFVTGAAVTAIAPGMKVTYEGKRGPVDIEAEAVLMAVGRRPVMPEGLDEAGVEYTRRGITVDPATMLTTAPGVYAIGDVNGLCMLAHAATAQGRVVLGEKIDLDVIPSAVFTAPEAAMVGLTAAKAAERYGDVKVSSVMYGVSGKAVAMGEPMGVVKLLTYGPERRIAGASILGAHASDLIQEVATAMAAGLSADALARTVHAHPTLSELVMLAAEQ